MSKQIKEQTIDAIQLKALLLDSITKLKFGFTLAQNYPAAKHRLCKMVKLPKGISTIKFIRVIGLIYKDNDNQKEFDRIIHKFKIQDKINI